MGVYPRIEATIRQLVDWLVVADYRAIEVFTGGERLSAADLQQVIENYGRKLISIPSCELEKLDVIEIVGSCPRSWSVRVDLWTEEDGRSDLTLECTMCEGAGEVLDTDIDNIHVV